MYALTEQQAAVLDAIREYWREHGIGPTTREIADLFGWNVNGVRCHLIALEKKGAVEWPQDKKARHIWPAGLRESIRQAAAANDSPAAVAG